MKFETLIIILCSWLWYSVSSSFGSKVKNGTVVNADRRTSRISDIRLSQSERNRRLIPYATYYIAGNSDQSNSIHNNPFTMNQHSDNEEITNSKPKHYGLQFNSKSQYKTEEDYPSDYHQDSLSGYTYVPVAYIPGGRSLNSNAESHYYPNSYQQNPVSMEEPKQYPTVKQKSPTSTITPIIKKHPYSYPKNFASTVTPSPNVYYNYAVTPGTNVKQVTPKPSHYTINSIPIPVSPPSSDYLNFRYSNMYKSQAPKYDVPTTLHTVEITSPKHYIIPNSESAATMSSLRITTPYAINYEYPEEAQFSHASPLTRSKSIKYSAKIPEQVTQSSKTLMTIMKSQEIPYQPEDANYHLEYMQKPQTVSFLKNTPDYTVDDILSGYNVNNQLPERITADNLQQSIKTLSYILQVLHKADTMTRFQKQPILHSKDIFESLKETSPLLPLDEHKSVGSLQSVDASYDSYDDEKDQFASQLFEKEKSTKDDQSTPGRAGIDYPTYSTIPETSFTCKTQRYKGFFADPETKCQVWHYCDLNGGEASFLCPNGTTFNQAALTCDWWFNVKCAATSQLYVLNERLYKYILPVKPSFPEDFSGPLVDQYLTEKFKEIELKRKYRYPTNVTTAVEQHTNLNLTALNEYEIPAHLLNENL